MYKVNIDFKRPMNPIKFGDFFVTTFDHPERSPEKQQLLGSTSSRRAQLLWLSLGGSRMAFSGKKSVKKSVKTPGERLEVVSLEGWKWMESMVR